MHAASHQGCMDTVRESALEADSGRKIPCTTTDLNHHQYRACLFCPTLYQLSCPRPLQTSILIIFKNVCIIVLSLAGAATSIIFVVTKHAFCHDKNMLVATNMHFCHNKSMLVATKSMLPQNYVCCDKYLLQQKFCHDRNTLSRQMFCHNKDKHTFCRNQRRASS